jgi:hypothetical protein
MDRTQFVLPLRQTTNLWQKVSLKAAMISFLKGSNGDFVIEKRRIGLHLTSKRNPPPLGGG